MHQGRSSRQLAIWAGVLAETADCFKQVITTYVHVLYLSHEDTIIAVLCMGLPITTSLADQWLNSLTFHDDIKYVHYSLRKFTQILIICVMSQLFISCKILENAKSFLIYAYGFRQHHNYDIKQCFYQASQCTQENYFVKTFHMPKIYNLHKVL